MKSTTLARKRALPAAARPGRRGRGAGSPAVSVATQLALPETMQSASDPLQRRDRLPRHPLRGCASSPELLAGSPQQCSPAGTTTCAPSARSDAHDRLALLREEAVGHAAGEERDRLAGGAVRHDRRLAPAAACRLGRGRAAAAAPAPAGSASGSAASGSAGAARGRTGRRRVSGNCARLPIRVARSNARGRA